MPRLSKETKERIKALSKTELEEIVLKFASKEKGVYDYLKIHHLDTGFGEEEVIEEVEADLDVLFLKNYRGQSPELKAKNRLIACNKRINQFAKISKDKALEADLLVYILDKTFSSREERLGTAFTAYDSKIGMMVKKLITLVTKKLHPDLKIEYRDTINTYLNRLHRYSNHIDFIYDLPQKV